MREPIIRISQKDLFARNIEKGRQRIQKDLLEKETQMNRAVDTALKKVFANVYNNVELFLDYHYSIRGEYAELGYAATGHIDRIIRDRLFGKGFERDFKSQMSKIEKRYAILLQSHGELIGEIASEGIDIRLNEAIVDAIGYDIAKNVAVTATTFIGVAGGTKLASRIVPKITAKFLSKAGAKLAAKTTAKTAGKVAAAETGAAGGVLCGPFVWICSPLLATAAWFATDAAVIQADEMLTRESFRKEILFAIDQKRSRIEKELKRSLAQSFEAFSLKARSRYKKEPVKVKEMIYKKESQ
ncbi:hypothetical protein [Hydrogenimonas urashimensis]|uniref:hypothetical protein n=1 Tax=Hydrogenimonas urashimensis TaxID=2740515 RepID=UPI001914EE59|nr:hypothetical protein [Hydrogenimonas urashimensis]